MQLAERSRGSVAIALCAVSVLGTAALTCALRSDHFQRFDHRYHHKHHHGFSSEPLGRCHESFAQVAVPPAPSITSVDGVLAAAQPLFAPCFAHDGRPTELLVTVAPDGRVRATTTRPEPETHVSRCLSKVMSGLVFPAAPTTVMMRVPIGPNR